jgi:outer membrane protein OmpA-like peptidoglycan-associated protein
LEGGLTWVSPKYKAGQSKFFSTEVVFKPGSILDDTQRLIESADRLQGEQKFKHVGNAINQISKIFNDGYRQITKGSQVVTYKDPLFEQKVGEEYCRVFTKADTYSTYDRLQKPEGISGYGRRFQNTILDNTYNLNIAPLKGENSTNVSGGSVKKYMFSLENLAWKSGARKGYTYEDLPACEKGPNGGRIMWFPPYGLTFNDNSSANWDEKAFLGRPEPIYTYKNTSRNGSLSWKIVVDHPSVLNILVNKVLANETPLDASKMLESFFAGCQKYDLYDLASKYGTVNRSALQEIQTILNTSPAEYENIVETITIEPSDNSQVDPPVADEADTQTADLQQYVGLGFYFDNNIPPPNQGTTASGPYNSYYSSYIGKKDTYINKAKNNPTAVGNFFDQVVTYNFNTIKESMLVDLYNVLKEGGEVTIEMEGSASASASDAYNLNLSKRRIDSVIKFLSSYSAGGDPDPVSFSKYIDEKKLRINPNPQGESATVSPKGSNGFFDSKTCNENPTYTTGANSGKTMTDSDAIYTVESMGCRSVRFKTINVIPVLKTPPPPVNDNPVKPPEQARTEERITGRKVTKEAKTTTTENIITRPGLSKKVLRDLLTECDYFEVLKNEDPFIYDELRKKLKIFSPSFHSITPEGLNSRLTFLNQCVRPGDTIPVIGEDGAPKYNDSVNTAFGSPPVLVLRVGDFYHTKIIPKSLQISYEQIYDMNPEGIGFQPMIANVQLSFDFIGGQGLARPVEDLQNALSFNYYANTEIYDDRSVATEDVTKLDALIDEKKKINTEIKPRPVSETQPNAGGKTIGNITSNILGKTSQKYSDVSETGKLSYRDLMRQIVDQSQTYFGTVISKLTSLSESYNYGIVRTITTKRSYTNGDVANTNDTAMLFGKCSETQQQINKLIDDVKSDINQNNNKIINYYVSKGFSLSGTVITQIKTNMLNYVESMRQDFVNGINIELEQLYTQELSLISLMDKMNIIYSDIDGRITNSGEVVVLNLSGDSQTDLKSDYALLPQQYQDFLTFIYAEQILSQPNSTFTYTSDLLPQDYEKRFFMLMSKIFLDKNNLETFKNVLLPEGNSIGGVNVTVPKKPEDVMNKILGLRVIDLFDFGFGFDSMHEVFSKEQKQQNKKYNLQIRSAVKYNKYVNFFNPFNKLSNDRILDYVKNPSPTDQQKQKFTDLASTTNTGDPNKFNGKLKFN